MNIECEKYKGLPDRIKPFRMRPATKYEELVSDRGDYCFALLSYGAIA